MDRKGEQVRVQQIARAVLIIATLASCSCRFTDIPSTSPGASCLIGAQWVDAGMLYRARTFLVVYKANGTVRTTDPSFSLVTS